MNRIADARNLLGTAMELLDDLGEWAAAAHVSTAISLLYTLPGDAIATSSGGQSSSPRASSGQDTTPLHPSIRPTDRLAA